MQLSSRRRKRGGLELNLTSMIDVIFLLLIFFIVNAGFQQAERDLESGLQVQAKSSKRSNLEPVIVEIVGSDDSFSYKVGARTANDGPALLEVLKSIPNKGNGAFVRVRDDVPFVLAATAVQAAHDAGFPTVSYVPLASK